MVTVVRTVDVHEVETRRNLVPNSSFEAASGVTEVRRNRAINPAFRTGEAGWNIWSTGAGMTGEGSRPTSGGIDNEPYRRWTILTPGNGGMSTSTSLTNDPIDAGLGEVLTLSIYVRSSKAITVRLDAQPYDRATATPVTATLGEAVTLTPNVWTRISVTAAVPAGATTIRGGLSVFVNSLLAAGDTVDIARYMSEKSPTLGPYFDGSVQASPDPDLTASWGGTPNASDSILTGAAVVGASAGGGARNVQSGQWSRSGQKSVRSIPTSSSVDSFIPVGGDTGAMRLGMVAGKTYTALVTARLSAPQTGASVNVSRMIRVFYRLPSGQYNAFNSLQAPNVAGEHQIRHTFTLPADATEAFIRLQNGASANGGDVWWDDFLLVDGEYAGPYFDGNSASVDSRRYVWAGAPNASASIEYSVLPLSTVTPLLVDGYEATRDARSVVHEVAGKTFPDVTLRPAGSRRGRLRMLFATETDATAAYAALSAQRVFMLTEADLPGIEMRFVIADGEMLIGLDDEGRRRWWVEVPFVEVSP